MKKRIKNLTPSKIKKIASIVTTILVLAFIAIGINLIPDPKLQIFLILAALSIGSVLALLVNNTLLRITESSDYKAKEIANTFLCKDKFTQVSFFLNCSNSEAEMLSTILKAECCRFYAKFTEDDNILLIVKDKNDDEIYNTIISNYFYFTSHFKQKEI